MNHTTRKKADGTYSKYLQKKFIKKFSRKTNEKYMKKNIHICLLSVLLSMTGCTNDILIDEGISSSSFTLKVKVENTIGSRTMIDEFNNVLWTEGDSIGVFMEGSSESVPFEYAGMTGNIANFTSNVSPGKVVAAYYPYNKSATLKENSLSVFLPSEHDYTEGHTNGEMLGMPTGENTLYFKHLSGMLKVTVNDIPSGAAKLTVRATSWPNPALQGEFKIEDINASEPVLLDNDFECQEVNYNFTEDYTGKSKTFYIPLPPNNYPLVVSLRTSDNEFLWYKKATVNIKRGTIAELPVVETTRPYAFITSHENGYTFSGHQTYTTIKVSGIIKNFHQVNSVKINLDTETNHRHAEYFIYGGAAYPQGKEKAFEHELDIYPGKNIFTISWDGQDTGYNKIKGDTTFVINYNEEPVIAEAVDMGLSVKWAKHNLGAKSENDYGCLYMWGDPTGTDLRREDTIYTVFEKNYDNINNICGDIKHDVVKNKWGGSWRMPSEKDFQELLDTTKVEREYVTIDGVNGIKLTSLITGNSIFLPSAGYYYNYHDLRERNTIGRYMAGVEYYDRFNHHSYFNVFSYSFNSTYKDPNTSSLGYFYFVMASSIRPVKE